MTEPETLPAAVPEAKLPRKRSPQTVPISGGISHLAGAICQITAELEEINKTGKHPMGYKYATAPDVIRELAPRMSKAGIVVFQSEKSWQMLPDGVLRIEFEYDIVHAPTGETRTIVSSGTSKVSGGQRGGYNDKASAAIGTMVKKYMLISLFNAVVDDLPDADTHTQTDARPPTPAPNPMRPIESNNYDDQKFEEINKRMMAAASKGSDALEEERLRVDEKDWPQLSLPVRKKLSTFYDDRYKVIAWEVDAQNVREGRR